LRVTPTPTLGYFPPQKGGHVIKKEEWGVGILKKEDYYAYTPILVVLVSDHCEQRRGISIVLHTS
jgi:hypothetical protein